LKALKIAYSRVIRSSVVVISIVGIVLVVVFLRLRAGKTKGENELRPRKFIESFPTYLLPRNVRSNRETSDLTTEYELVNLRAQIDFNLDQDLARRFPNRLEVEAILENGSELFPAIQTPLTTYTYTTEVSVFASLSIVEAAP